MLEHVLVAKPFHTLAGHALARVPAGWNHPAEKDSRQVNMLEHVLVAKPFHTLAGHALGAKLKLFAGAKRAIPTNETR